MKKQQVVLITGASSGIGHASALSLQKAGYIVYAAARRLERMDDLKAQGIHPLSLDVTDEESLKAGVARIMAEQGRIDILINNAGYGSYGAVEDVPLANARAQFEVNLFGLARLTQLVLPGMRANHFGKIVNISSIGGKMHEPLGAWYHTSKFALEGFSDCLRVEVRHFGIDVIVIEPGGIQTEWQEIAAEHLQKTSGQGAYKDQAERHAAFLRKSGRYASKPEVIAAVIVKALRARCPKTRYAAGSGACPILFLRKVLCDRAFDRLLLFVLRHA